MPTRSRTPNGSGKCVFFAFMRIERKRIFRLLALSAYPPTIRDMNLTPAQCRAARGLVNMTQQQLAEAIGVSLRTITHFEKDGRTPIPAILRALKDALEAAGVIFIPSNGEGAGVRLRRNADSSAESRRDGS